MDQEVIKKKSAELEAILFIQGEPLSKKRLQKALELEPEDLSAVLEEIEKKLAAGDRGLALVRDDDKIQFATKPEFKAIVEAFIKAELSEDITPASLEVLSLVTYLGPVSKSDIEYRRGVNSSFTLRNLLIRGLIERVPESGRAGAHRYRPTFEFMRHLGVSKKEELPEYEKFSSILSKTGTDEPAHE